jgi:hypothetical protein
VGDSARFANPADPGVEFWTDFVRRFWGRRPTVIRQPFARAIASPAEVFGAMVAATGRLRSEALDFALTIDGARAAADIQRWLPTKKDGSLERFGRRIGCDVPGRTFAVFVPQIQIELGWAVWTRVRRFLNGLYTLVGVPAHRAEIDLFAGNYPHSRRGIHLDSADVFCLVIEGRKRIRVWPGSSFSESRGYWYGFPNDRNHRANSLCLDGEPGDILYWPSSYWHVGESRGGTVCSLSLGLYWHDSLAATASRLMEDEVTRALGADNVAGPLPFSLGQIDAVPQRALRAFSRAADNLSVTMLRRRMEHVTAHAFAHLPQPPDCGRLRTSSSVAADPASAIFYRSDGRTAIIAANGRSIVLPGSKRLKQMIQALNRGAHVSLSDAAQGRVNGHLRDALRFLLSCGAVEIRRGRGLPASRGR